MKVQNHPGIYAYYVDNYSLHKKVNFWYFDNWKSFFNVFRNVKYFKQQFGDWSKIWHTCERDDVNYYWRNVALAYYAIYDQDGNWFPPEYLVEQYVKYEKARKKRIDDSIHSRRHGRKRKAWGHYHRIETFRSNREFYYDEEAKELGIDIKYRNRAVPPDSWDREKFSSMEKSWKCQSKRPHQWKGKDEWDMTEVH